MVVLRIERWWKGWEEVEDCEEEDVGRGREEVLRSFCG